MLFDSTGETRTATHRSSITCISKERKYISSSSTVEQSAAFLVLLRNSMIFTGNEEMCNAEGCLNLVCDVLYHKLNAERRIAGRFFFGLLGAPDEECPRGILVIVFSKHIGGLYVDDFFPVVYTFDVRRHYRLATGNLGLIPRNHCLSAPSCR